MRFLRTLIPVAVFGLAGCSVLNFSANYYTPPADYQQEIVQVWNKVRAQIPLKYDYKISIIGGRDSNRLDGIPAISEHTVLFPEDFVKYVYQNYYDDRFKILSTVMVHEISHREFDLPSKPSEKHFETDVRAIQLLGGDAETVDYFYKSLYVMKSYWFARKGVAGHAFNVSWNAISLASATLGGPSFFVDWYATDLETRMSLIAKHYNLKSKKPFRRSQEPSK